MDEDGNSLELMINDVESDQLEPIQNLQESCLIDR